jgi:hypothetical protein
MMPTTHSQSHCNYATSLLQDHQALVNEHMSHEPKLIQEENFEVLKIVFLHKLIFSCGRFRVKYHTLFGHLEEIIC